MCCITLHHDLLISQINKNSMSGLHLLGGNHIHYYSLVLSLVKGNVSDVIKIKSLLLY